VTLVGESRLNINDLLDCCSHCKCLSGSGKRLPCIVDRLTKVAQFIPVKTTYSGPQLAELYMSRIVYLHGVPKKIVSDRGTQITLRFWERLHGTRLAHDQEGSPICHAYTSHYGDPHSEEGDHPMSNYGPFEQQQ
jgi:hypothetical protein